MKSLLSFSREKGWKMMIKTRTGIATLAGIDGFGYPVYVSTDNTLSAASSAGTSQLWSGGSLGLSLSGGAAGMKGRLGIWDGGKVNLTHVELRNRVIQKDNPPAPENHSTHVSGIMINTGINSLARGMAYNCQRLVAYDYLSHMSEMATEGSNLLVSNHSYTSVAGWNYNDGESRWEFFGKAGDNEDYKFGYYSEDARQWDEIAYNAPYYLIVKAAGNNRTQKGPATGEPWFRMNTSGVMSDAGSRPPGISSNDGYDVIATYGTSKNILTVGAIQPFSSAYTGAADAIMADFSSWGPTDDGRIKPDIVADGVTLLSSTSRSDNSYGSLSGTSMASPVVAGSVFLLQEYYSQLHPDTFMRAATLKGLLIHTALEAGIAPGPDYQFGWGVVNMQKAAEIIQSNNKDQFIYEQTLESGASFSLPLTASGKGPLTVTICWTDPQGVVDNIGVLNNRTPKLINDLDLRVRSGATEYLPWKLNAMVPSAAATQHDNTADNVEKIEIPNAVPGTEYMLQLTHKNALARDRQAYSLIISGAGGNAYCSPTLGTGARISGVQFGSFNNIISGECAPYRFFYKSQVVLENNLSVPFTVTLGDCSTPLNRMVKIFVDYNQDGDFADEGETVAASNTVTGSFNGAFLVTNNVTPGFSTRLRVEVKETADAAGITGCDLTGSGEVQDYIVVFNPPSSDMAIPGIILPEAGACAAARQPVTIRIRNVGSTAQDNIPVSTVIKNGETTVATLTAIYPGTIGPGKEVGFTYPSSFNTLPGNVYTLTTSCSLPGDQNFSNNQQVVIINTSNAGTPPASVSARICGNDVSLKAIDAGGGQLFWYQGAGSSSILASGYDAGTDTITPDKKYYAAINDVVAKGGLADKSVSSSGRYDNITNNLVRFTTSVPLTIENLRLYTGHAGKIKFTLGKAVDDTRYQPVASATIDVFATDPTPAAGMQANYEPGDAGAVFTVNLPVPEPGNYFLVLECLEGATLFYNNGISVNPYPISIPDVLSITGNSAKADGNPDFYQRIYLAVYDIGIRLYGCASNRIAVNAADCTNGTTAQLGIEPNPNNGEFRLRVDLPVSGELSVFLANVAGQNMFNARYPAFAGSFLKDIHTGYLPPGIYILRVQQGGKTYTRKMIIINK